MKIYVVISRYGVQMNEPIACTTREKAQQEMQNIFNEAIKEFGDSVTNSEIDGLNATIETIHELWEAEICKIEVKGKENWCGH